MGLQTTALRKYQKNLASVAKTQTAVVEEIRPVLSAQSLTTPSFAVGPTDPIQTVSAEGLLGDAWKWTKGVIVDAAKEVFGGGPTGPPTPGCSPGYVMTSAGCVPQSLALPPTNGTQVVGPKTAPGTTSPGFPMAVAGSFGMPAIVPVQVGVIQGSPIRRCPKGLVLGTDDLCYPKAVLSRRSKFRKWRQPARAPVSAADARIARKYKSVQERIKDIGGDVNLTVANKTTTKTKIKLISAGDHENHHHGSH